MQYLAVLRVDLNEGCVLVFFSVFSRHSGISWFFPIGKYQIFGKILKKTEKHSSLRSNTEKDKILKKTEKHYSLRSTLNNK